MPTEILCYALDIIKTANKINATNTHKPIYILCNEPEKSLYRTYTAECTKI